MLYIVGLGLNEKGISLEGKEAVKKCSQIYLENYTVEFPYSPEDLKKSIGKKFEVLDRGEVESERLIIESKKEDVGLLIYGCPLFATTHMSLIEECRERKVKVKVIYASSVFDAIGSSGLELYKFGKISSMPKWQEKYRPHSFLEYVKDNMKIDAHSLILVDIGLEFKDALEELREASEKVEMKLEKILVCSRLGSSKGKIFYGNLKNLKSKRVLAPFCFIIPGKMHFMEEGVVEGFEMRCR